MEPSTPELTVEYAPLNELAPHPHNPHVGDIPAIVESLTTNGQYRPIVVSRATGHVLAGNHTLAAATELGWLTIAATYLPNLTPEQELRILLADNRTAELGTNDTELLLAALEDLPDLTGTGYAADYVDDLLAATDRVDEIEPPATDAHLNETPEQLATRRDRLEGYQSLTGQGLAEVILIVTNEKRDQLYAWVERLRAAWGAELTNGEIVHAAVARVVEQIEHPNLTPEPRP